MPRSPHRGGPRATQLGAAPGVTSKVKPALALFFSSFRLSVIYRRLSRIAETVVDVADRVWYAAAKEM